MAFGFFSDPAGTTPLISSLQFVQAMAGPTPADRIIYFGIAGGWVVADGGGDIVATITGAAAGDVALALSASALPSAVPGAPLVIGERVDGVVPIYVRVLDSSHASGTRLFSVESNTLEAWR